MALLASIEIDDAGALKISRASDLLRELDEQGKKTAEGMTRSGKQAGESFKPQQDALTRLLQDHRTAQLQIAATAKAGSDLANIMKTGATVTRAQADALDVLNKRVQETTYLSAAHKRAAAELTQSLMVGTTVTADQTKRLTELAKGHVEAARAQLEGVTAKQRWSVAAVAETLVMAGLIIAIKRYTEESFQVAARNEVIATSLGIVAKNSNQSSVAFETAAQQVKGLGITTKEARTAIIDFAQANLSLADASKLARVAQDLAAVAGENSSETFKSLTHAIELQYPRLLRQYGIIMGLDTIYGKFAQTIHKNVSELNSNEKRQAFMNTILEQGEQVAGAYTASMNDVGKAMLSTARYTEELENKFGQAFLPVMKLVVDAEQAVLGGLTKLPDWVFAVAAGFAAFAIPLGSVIGLIRGLTFAMNALKLQVIENALLALQGPVGWLVAGIGALVGLFIAYKAITTVTVDAVREHVAAANAQIKTMDDLKTKVDKASSTLEDFRKRGQEPSKEAIENTTRAVGALRTHFPDLIKSYDALTGAVEFNTDAVDRNRIALENNLRLQVSVAKTELSKLAEERESLNRQLADVQKQINANNDWLAHPSALTVTEATRNGRVSKLRTADELRPGIESSLAEGNNRAIALLNDLKSVETKMAGFQEIVSAFDPSAIFDRTRAGLDKLLDYMKEKGVSSSAIFKGLGTSLAEVEARVSAVNAPGISARDSQAAHEALVAFFTKATSAADSAAEAAAKWGNAVKKGLDTFLEDNAVAGANFESLGQALATTKVGTEDYLRILMKGEGTLKAYNNETQASLDKLVATGKLTQKVRDALKAPAEAIAVQPLMAAFEQYAKKAKDTIDSISESMSSMFQKMRDESEMTALKGAQDFENLKIANARSIEKRQEDLSDRATDPYTSDVDKKIRANDRYYRDFTRSIDDEIRGILQKRKIEALANSQKEKEETASLNRTLNNAQRAFNIEKTLTDAKIKLAQAYWAVVFGATAESQRAGLEALKVGFDADIEAIRKQGLAEIGEKYKVIKANAAQEDAAQDQYITDLKATQVDAVRVHAKTNQQILKESSYTWGIVKGLAGGMVDTFTAGLGKMIDGTARFRDVMSSIWGDIKNTVMGVMRDIMGTAVKGLLGIGTQSSGKSGMLEALGQAGLIKNKPGEEGASGLLGGGSMSKLMGGLTIATSAFSIGGAIGHATGSKVAGGAIGAGTGAATGAFIGSHIFPGIGTAIGAGIGAIAGAVGGLIGAGAEQRHARDLALHHIQKLGGTALARAAYTKYDPAGGMRQFNILMSALAGSGQFSPKEVERAIQWQQENSEIFSSIQNVQNTFGGSDAAHDLAMQSAAGKQAWDATHLTGKAAGISPEQAAAAADALDRALSLQKAKNGLAQTFSQLMDLGRAAKLVGFDMGALYNAKSIEDFNAQQTRLNELLEKQKLKVQGVTDAFAGITQRASGLSTNLTAGSRGTSRASAQASFASIGQSVVAAFSGMVALTGDLSQAMAAATGPMNTLVELQQRFGFAADAGLTTMLTLFKVMGKNSDVVDSLSGITAELKGLADAGLLTQDLFNNLGDETSRQAQMLNQRGVDAASRDTMLQPTLQKLFEAQKEFGFTPDAQTAQLIQDALSKGLIGDRFQDTSLKMLDQLRLIATILGQRLPGGGHAPATPGLGWEPDAGKSGVVDPVSGVIGPLTAGLGGVQTVPTLPELPSFDGRPLERVVGAGLAMLHPGDVVGVPPSGSGMSGGGGGNVVHLHFDFVDGTDLEQALERRVIPRIQKVLDSNGGQAATRMADSLTRATRQTAR